MRRKRNIQLFGLIETLMAEGEEWVYHEVWFKIKIWTESDQKQNISPFFQRQKSLFNELAPCIWTLKTFTWRSLVFFDKLFFFSVRADFYMVAPLQLQMIISLHQKWLRWSLRLKLTYSWTGSALYVSRRHKRARDSWGVTCDIILQTCMSNVPAKTNLRYRK